jgi:hypothetical protein
LADLRFEDFSGRLGETFEVDLGEVRVALTLTEATPLPRAMREAGGFRLEWTGPAEQLLNQGTYSIRLPGGEVHDIFIVAIACDSAGARYEAIFN